VLGSPESLADFMDMMGHTLKQTEVLASRALLSGKTRGITLRQVGDGSLGHPTDAQAFMAEVKKRLPKEMTIADGYDLIIIDGQPAIRIFHRAEAEEAKVTKKGKKVPAKPAGWRGAWKPKEGRTFLEVVHAVAEEKGINFNIDSGKFDVESEFNNWKSNPNGEAYRNSLKERGRIVLEKGLDDSQLRLLSDDVRPPAKRQRSKILAKLGTFVKAIQEANLRLGETGAVTIGPLTRTPKVRPLIVVGAFHIERGLRSFDAWSKQMIADHGVGWQLALLRPLRGNSLNVTSRWAWSRSGLGFAWCLTARTQLKS